MKPHIIERVNLNEAAEDAIRGMIMDGRLEAGARINEVHLAGVLGVSRTPLREALGRLSSEGSLEVRPRFGYFVKPLTLDEFEQIYAIRPLLDPAALKVAGLPGAEQIEALDTLNRQLLKVRDPAKAIELDDAWHLRLLAHCPNGVLVGLIRQFMARTRRYELALMREAGSAATAADHHARILEALKARRLNAACTALKENLEWGREPVANWLKSRGVRNPKGTAS